jgi:UDP-N-acetylmuramoyl-L-alanyl-D-glutamate--2,6-diaminopimelate ligase
MMALRKPTDEMTLSFLLEGLVNLDAADDRSLVKVEIDSREVQSGDLFLACKGERSNGTQYIEDAINAGACAVLVDAELYDVSATYSVPVISVENLSAKTGLIADRFYQHPSATMNVIGITGTNGKTSTAHFIAQVLTAANSISAGVIGTLGIGTPGKMQTSLNTTPNALTIHRAMHSMQVDGLENIVMEVSSHALQQARVAGVNFDIGVFTNLSREHLDYHGDMETYAQAKRQLFLTESLHSAVINIDDEYGQQLANELKDDLKLITYAVGEKSKAGNTQNHVCGVVKESGIARLSIDVQSPWGEGNITSKLTGAFNAGNLLASLSVLCLSGVKFENSLKLLSELEAVPGRMECFTKNARPRVIVDYAHTPDALEKSLASLRDITSGKLICVVGCGGDRDQGKRPMMGKLAETYADQIIVTNDNPRNEKPESIINQMLAGMEQSASVVVIPDRAAAISEAINIASEEDVILVAGKGHETYQEIAGVRSPFSDRQLVRNLLEQSE